MNRRRAISATSLIRRLPRRRRAAYYKNAVGIDRTNQLLYVQILVSTVAFRRSTHIVYLELIPILTLCDIKFYRTLVRWKHLFSSRNSQIALVS